MNRLVHSDVKAYLRYMQTSRFQLFAFLEGHTDRNFYGRLCSNASCESGLLYQIVTAEELPPKGTGGKPGLLNFYSELASREKLFDVFKGKSMASIFFVDKDVDDVLGKQIGSPHVVYTECYDVEGQTFRYGNLREAAAAAALVEPPWFDELLLDGQAWLVSAAQRWREWLQLCLLCATQNIRCECGYGNVSQINVPPNADTNPDEFKRHVSIVEHASGLSREDFDRIFDEVRQLVEDMYRRSKHHEIFKGKWYARIMEADVKAIEEKRGIRVKTDRFGDRLTSTLLSNLSFEGQWADHFVRPTREMFSRLKESGS